MRLSSPLFAASTLAATPAYAQLTFADLTLEEALAQASAPGGGVLLDVYATWCGPCQRLDEEVFPTTLAGEAAAGLVAIKVDAEAGEGPAIVERYHVVGYPTVLVLDAEGNEVDRIFGFLPAEEFASTLRSYRDGSGTITALRAAVEAEPGDLERVLELAERLAVRGEIDDARPHLDRVIAEDADNALGLRSRAHHFVGKYVYLRSQANYARAVAEFDVVLASFPGAPEALSCRIQRGIAQTRAGQTEDALASFEAAIAVAPDDSSLYNAIAWTLYRERAALDAAVAIARRGLAVRPDDASLWDTLAEVQFANGDAEGARASIEEALRFEPDSAYYAAQRARFGGGDAGEADAVEAGDARAPRR